jgi:hypothetical protein
MQNLQRVRRYQRELEDAEGRADQAESSLHLLRAKSRASVVTGKGNSPKGTYLLGLSLIKVNSISCKSLVRQRFSYISYNLLNFELTLIEGAQVNKCPFSLRTRRRRLNGHLQSVFSFSIVLHLVNFLILIHSF